MPKTKKIVLRECPFCGGFDMKVCRGQIVGTRDNGLRFVRCAGCGAQTGYHSDVDAVAAWNRRVQNC